MAIPTDDRSALAAGPHVGVSRRRSLFIWGLFCAAAGGIFLIYAGASLAAGRGEIVMPLDDVYIHFQYAKQFAAGQPYVYNPGLPPSSGATSFLYPYVLAVGYLIGFQGLNLGLWAMLVGALMLLASEWAIYWTGLHFGAPDWLAAFMALAFAFMGPVAWHFMSGMETGLMMALTLLTFYAAVAGRFGVFVVAASLLSLARPEGSVMAVLAAGVVFIQNRRELPRRRLLWLIMPVLAALVQPGVNYLLTHSFAASGTQAKSILGTVPPDSGFILGRIVENFARMWTEFVTGFSPVEDWYLPLLTVPAALLGLALLLARHKWRWIGLLALGWLLAVSAAISTLDTAFWHFKRYQMPLMALFFPLAIYGLVRLLRWRPITRVAVYGYLLIVVGFAALTGAAFLQHEVQNVQSVAAQPLQMARWLLANTPPDAVVAVHDVGMMRYIGERTTVDMVGLTTAGAADSWRNGPGATAQFLEDFTPRPDYVAAYTEARGLSYLAQTGIYGTLLASYTVDYDPAYNVALGGHFQGIYRADWSAAQGAGDVLQPSTLRYLTGFSLVDSVDVADLKSEGAHDYVWSDDERLPGYPTEVYQMDYIDCAANSCTVLDGGRLINGDEAFTVAGQAGQDMILVTRLHPQNGGAFDVYANDTLVGTRTIPVLPGRWLEVATLIPARLVTSRTRIRIVAHTPDGHYMPYYHWAYQGTYTPETSAAQPLAVYQDGAFALAASDWSLETGDDGRTRLALTLTWQSDGAAQGDYVVFAHLYADVNQPPVAQTDSRPGNGTLPPGNWLPGVFRDTIMIDVSEVPPGTYQLAVGMYDPRTVTRLPPQGGDPSGRVFLGEVEIPNHGR